MALKDLPDYTREMILRFEGGFIGLEELAARLGSIVPWDLRGNIVLMEDFESEETEWVEEAIGSGCSATRSSRHKYSGDWSVKLVKNTGVNNQIRFVRYIHFPGLLKYAAFARFAWDSNCGKIYFLIYANDGTTTYEALVEYDLITTTLSIITTAGAVYTLDTALNLSQSYYTWYPILVTFDLATGYYDKLYFADKEYDISTVPLYSWGDVTSPLMEPELGSVWAQVEGFTFYVDDIIVVKNVP